jgi:hypothetical protein
MKPPIQTANRPIFSPFIFISADTLLQTLLKNAILRRVRGSQKIL